MTSRGCWLIQPATATTRHCNTWGTGDIRGASLAEALGGHEHRDPASVQRRISPSDGVDRVLGQYEVELWQRSLLVMRSTMVADIQQFVK